MKNKYLALILVFVLGVTLVTGCSSKSVEADEVVVDNTVVKIATLKGPTGVGMVKLMEDDAVGSKYEFTIANSPDQIIGKISTGEIDVAAVPTNLASVLYKKTQKEIQLAAVNTLGVLYLVENGDTINEFNDIEGKTVVLSGKGASPDYVLNYLIKEKGLENVTLDFKNDHSEVLALIATGETDIVLLPQPFTTLALLKNEENHIASDLNVEWDNAFGEEDSLTMGCIIVRKEFAKNHKEAFENFLSEYKESVTWVESKVDESSVLLEKYEILPNAKTAALAIPNTRIVYLEAMDAKEEVENYLKTLMEFNPKSIGGEMPDEEFYYVKSGK